MNDRELIELFAARHLQAIEQTEAAYKAYCAGIAQSLLQDAQAIEACVGEVWMLAWERVPEQKPENLKLFVGKLTRELCLEHLANQPESASAELAAVLCELGELASDEADLSAQIPDEKFCSIVQIYLQGLSERERCLFVRRYYFAESVERIALRYDLTKTDTVQILGIVRNGLGAVLGRKVCIHELSALALIGEIDPAMIESSERFKPDRRQRRKRRKLKKVHKVLIILAAVLLVVVVVPAFTAWLIDGYVQREWNEYDGTALGVLDYFLTQDDNLISGMIGEDGRERLHQSIDAAGASTQIVLHGSEGLIYTSLDNGTCMVTGMVRKGDKHVLIPMISPEGEIVVAIDAHAFDQNRSITEVTVPITVLQIERFAFQGCENLQAVHLPATLQRIGVGAFNNCKNLTSLHLPAGVSQIGTGILSGCTSLESITVDPMNLFHHSKNNCLIRTMDGMLLAGCGSSIVVPDYVKGIEISAFENQTKLNEIYIPEGVTSIGENAFFNCYSLERITLPKSLDEVGYRAFAGCTRLAEVCYAGSAQDFGKIAFLAENTCLQNADIQYDYQPES